MKKVSGESEEEERKMENEIKNITQVVVCILPTPPGDCKVHELQTHTNKIK